MRLSSLLPLSLLACSLPLAAQTKTMTAEQVIARMREAAHVGVEPGTVDTIKAGDPKTVVNGIATTISPTMDVLRKAVAAGDNLILTHEPTFYNHADADTLFQRDPVYLEKLAYIRDHKLVVFRFHDGAHQRNPDFMMEGWAHMVGWTGAHRVPGGPLLYTSAPITVGELARKLEVATGAKVMRIVGDPNLQVTKLAYGPGAPGEARQIQALERDDVEVLVAGEIPEWETISYVWDAGQQGRHKAMILAGHYTSEEPGTKELAEWLRTVLPGQRIDFIPAGEPYSMPAATR